MKSIIKISFIATIAAIISTSGAFADNQRLENRLARQHAKLAETKTTTVAINTNDQGIGSSTSKGLRFEMLSNGHGETIGAYVAEK
jgi:hypothetical protein